MKLLYITLILFLSGCATYNPNNDPVYQAYLNGQITYADYVNHVDRINIANQQRWQNAWRGVSQSIEDDQRRRDQEYESNRNYELERRQTEAVEGIASKYKYGF